MNLQDLHLALFLSRSIPLKRWKQLGILERELTYYESLAARIRKLSIVSSGDEGEVRLNPNGEKIEILYNRWKLPANIYSLCSPFLHNSKLSSCNIFKTNQLDGAWSAIIAGKINKKPVIVRAGYLWAELSKSNVIDQMQAFSIKKASFLIVTSPYIRDHIHRKYQIDTKKTFVVPNYVNTELFRPSIEIEPSPNTILYIGRLHEIKNINSLIEALQNLPELHLTIIGEGQVQPELQRMIQDRNMDVTLQGIIPHNQIPVELNHADIFILPSLFEGHPKSLIEAMACGMPVIGTNVPGIREIIKHGETGWLCETDPNSLGEAINYVIGNRELKKKMGRNARNFILENYTLEKVLELEIDSIRSILNTQ